MDVAWLWPGLAWVAGGFNLDLDINVGIDTGIEAGSNMVPLVARCTQSSIRLRR